MSEEISGQNLIQLLETVYGVTVPGEPTRLVGEGGQLVFKVELSSGEVWTVRLASSRPREKLLKEINVLRFLNRQNFPAPQPKTTLAGEAVFEWQSGMWGYVLEFVEGQHPVKPPQLDNAPGPMIDKTTLIELGHTLGKLHILPFSKADELPTASWLDEVPHSIERAEFARQNPAWTQQAEEVIATLKALPLDKLKALPCVLVHTDAHDGNLIWTPDKKLFLLDWENAGLDVAVIDLALVLSWLCSWQPTKGSVVEAAEKFDFDEEYCKTFLANYQQERFLSEEESEMLGPTIQFLDGWFAARDIKREIAEPGSTGEMAALNWALMRSVTPETAALLTHWAEETAPGEI